MSVWYTFSSSTDQQDAEEEERDQSRNIFSKHPQMRPDMLARKEAEKQIHCEE